MNLNLSRPLVFFDIEATGLNIVSDRIVELCYIKVYPNGEEEARTMRFNPQIPISAEATSVMVLPTRRLQIVRFSKTGQKNWQPFLKDATLPVSTPISLMCRY